MNATRWAAVVLIVAGVLALAYGGFTYTRQTHEARVGPLELSIQETNTVNIPLWLGAAALIGGVLLLVVRARK